LERASGLNRVDKRSYRDATEGELLDEKNYKKTEKHRKTAKIIKREGMLNNVVGASVNRIVEGSTLWPYQYLPNLV
jgi:hypothetical protein